MHQRGIDWACLRRRPRQTPAGNLIPRHRTRGTRLRRPRSPVHSLHQSEVPSVRNRQTSTNK
jgi:hypothetical protein